MEIDTVRGKQTKPAPDYMDGWETMGAKKDGNF